MAAIDCGRRLALGKGEAADEQGKRGRQDKWPVLVCQPVTPDMVLMRLTVGRLSREMTVALWALFLVSAWLCSEFSRTTYLCSSCAEVLHRNNHLNKLVSLSS